MVSVTSRRTNAVPPSGSSRSARASTGTKIAVNVASSTRAAIRLGSWLATENARRQRGAEDGGQQHDAGEAGDPADQSRERHAPRPGHHRRVGQFRAPGPPPRCGPPGQPLRGRAAARWERLRGRAGWVAARWDPVERRWLRRTRTARGGHRSPPVEPARPSRRQTGSWRAAARRCPWRRRSRHRSGPAGPDRRGQADRGTGAIAVARRAGPAPRPPSSVMKNSTLP